MVAMHDRPRSDRRGAAFARVAAIAAGLWMLTGVGIGLADDAPADVVATEAEDVRVDPHGKPDACASCHQQGLPLEAIGAPKPSRELCVPCHETSDMHPSDVPVVSAEVPGDWPLEGDLLVCVTCHAEPSCVEGRATRAPYLRGSPYEHEIEFCWVCHPPTDYRRSDPHHPAARRDGSDVSCAFCHRGLPAAGAPPAESHLRTEPIKICELCHTGAVHAGTATHLAEIVGEERRGDLDPSVAIGPGGEVRCWTCHEVHGDVSPPPSVNSAADPYAFSDLPSPDLLWADEPTFPVRPAADPAHPSLLPRPGGELCRACHGAGP